MTTEANTYRNVTLDQLADQLSYRAERSKDYVVPASKLHANGGRIEIAGHAEVNPSPTMLGTMGQRLSIPTKYIKTVHARATETPEDNDDRGRQVAAHYRRAFDEMVNASLADTDRKFMVRTYESGKGTDYGRAMLSDKFKTIDNWDVIAAMISGVEQAGVDVEVEGCDLDDRNMRLRLSCPQVYVMAEEFLKGYRNPFDPSHTGYNQGEEPIIFAGFEMRNSETGFGAYSTQPRFKIKICQNGLVITEDVMREVHVGTRQAEGQVTWSDDTRKTVVELIGKQTRDAVTHFLNVEYLQASVDKLTALAGGQVDDVEGTIQVVAKQYSFTDEERAGILNRFIKGGQLTSGGVANAITAHAQDVEDPERAAELEAVAVPAMRTALAA